MNNHSFCRRMVSHTVKEINKLGGKIKVRNLQAYRPQKNDSHFEVYNGDLQGSYQGCCSWSAVVAYLNDVRKNLAGESQ